jgi:hypothetical protein
MFVAAVRAIYGEEPGAAAGDVLRAAGRSVRHDARIN